MNESAKLMNNKNIILLKFQIKILYYLNSKRFKVMRDKVIKKLEE